MPAAVVPQRAAERPPRGTRRLVALGAATLCAFGGLGLVAPRWVAPERPAQLAHAPRDVIARAAGHATPPAPAVAPLESGTCGPDMQLVAGTYCPYVGHRCLEWIQENRDRCRRYDEKILCEGLKVQKRFCIDRYEYPNQAGALPAVMTSWVEAEQACKAEGKRLCTESEWTFACEGEAKLPYPYGFERNAEACNIDRHYRDPNFSAFSHDRLISDEVSRLDQRVPSGAMSGCVSPFGVHDMTGNVDEWVVNEDPKLDKDEDVSSLKGGYWGPIRARCRPVTNSHNRWFRFYQVGFRCCADPKGSTQPVLP
ncbi:MAG: SUMF1/EgtB/PvdO family nonheme iron enzyme [Myxococcales bacterium]|nr:SUMF1/EgtB/PvdO family nonheme iron enzyme [Myxococcales bacterium]